MPKAPLNAIVTQRTELHPGLIILRIAPEGWELPEFQAGQFAVLALPAEAPRCANAEPERDPVKAGAVIKRAYSIGSSCRDLNALEFYVSLVAEGGLTPRLFALQPGDQVHLSPKITGKFTLEEVPADQDLVLMCTGTGLAPYISMLRSGEAQNRSRRIAVVHGVRNSWDLGYKAELEAMAAINDRITYLPMISRPQNEHAPWPGRVGYAQGIWAEGVLEPLWQRMPTAQDCHVFLCGNPSMINDAVEVLEKDGFQEHTSRQPGTLHMEKYW